MNSRHDREAKRIAAAREFARKVAPAVAARFAAELAVLGRDTALARLDVRNVPAVREHLESIGPSAALDAIRGAFRE